MSLPDDLKIAILKRLADGKDLARVLCVSAQLRLLVAEREGELWKTFYEALPLRPRFWFWCCLSRVYVPPVVVEVRSWRDMYMDRRRFNWAAVMWRPASSIISRVRRRWDPISFLESAKEHEQQKEQCTVATRAERNGSRHHRRQVARNDDDYIKRRHGVGAIHSPSSRYRWNHR